MSDRKEYKKEYYLKNKEKIKQHKIEYYQNNKKKIAEYYQNNKEKAKEYREKNKEATEERQGKKITCECGSTFRIDGKIRHEKSKKHCEFIKI